MTIKFLRLLILCVLLAACATRDLAPPAFEMLPQDPLRDSPAEWLWQSGVEARERNDLAAASRYFERAVDVVPDSSWLYRELAELRLRQGDDVAAEGLAKKALRFAPHNPVYESALWQLISTALMRQGNEAGAARARMEAEMLMGRSR